MPSPSSTRSARPGGARPTPLVIDCDPGIDDAVGLAMAVGSPEIELRGVTTVTGNVAVALATDNALRLLETFGRPDVPVAAGATRGIARTKPEHAAIHGLNGVGGVELPEPRGRPRPEHAVEFLAGVLREAAPHTVTIAAIGPLTNLALLTTLHPELTSRIDRVVMMGTTSGPGNVTPVSEYNVWAYPEAAQRVLVGSGLSICVVELAVTRRATLDDTQLARLRAGSVRGALLADMVGGYANDAPKGLRALHDAVVLAAIAEPGLLLTRPATVEVDTGTGDTRARTTFTPAAAGGVDADVQLAVDLDVERFRALVFERVAVPPS